MADASTLMETPPKTSLSLPFARGILLCGALVVFAGLISHYFYSSLGHDQVSYLFEARRMLSGSVPYGPHLSETNPPLIIWFSALPVLLARWLHGPEVLVFRVLILAMVFGSVTWCLRLLRLVPVTAKALPLWLMGCVLFEVEYRTGSGDFGQREHLLVILVLPYVLAVATGGIARLSIAERWALGIAAGFAIWFKPQDTLVLVALELFVVVRTRSLRRFITPDFLSVVVTSLLLLALVGLTAPLYFKDTFPLLLDCYWAIGTKTTAVMASHMGGYALMVICLLAACFLLRRSLRDPATCVALLLCSLAASVAFVVQHTEWPYHHYPHISFLHIALGWFAADLLWPGFTRLDADHLLMQRTTLVGAGLTALLLIAVAVHPRSLFPGPRGRGDDQLEGLLSRYKPGATVYVFSTSVPPLSIAYDHGLNWGSRYAHMWMMPSIVQNELGPTGPPFPFKPLPKERVAQLAALQRARSTEDLNYWKPAFVLVQRCTVERPCQGLERKDFSFVDWFMQSPEFAAVWSHYRKQSGSEDFDTYQFVP